MDDSRTDASSILVDRMWERIEITRGESETALFYELMFFGELLAKLLVLGLVAGVEPTRERHQYRLYHQLVRADGVGEWATVLDDILTGPASAHLLDEALEEKRELTKRFSQSDSSWQRDAVLALQRVCAEVDTTRPLSRGKVALRVWFNDFAWLRNRTRGHGAPKPTTCHQIVRDLEDSLREIVRHGGILNRGWVHLRRNLSGRYRVTRLSGDASRFEHLKSDDAASYRDGVYIAFGEDLRQVSLVETDADLTDIFVVNGGFRDTSQDTLFEMLSYYTDTTRLADGSAWTSPPMALPPSETRPRPPRSRFWGTRSPTYPQWYETTSHGLSSKRSC